MKEMLSEFRKKKIVCMSVIAFVLLVTTLALAPTIAADDFDCEQDEIPPTVEVIFGEPNIQFIGNLGEFPMIGAGTPVTLIATDPGYPDTGSGVSTLWVSTTGPSNLYPIHDGDSEDESNESGIIQVSFTFYDDCWHEIDYRAVDNCENYLPSEEGFLGKDFYVDATAPITHTEIVGPNIPIQNTPYTWFGSCTTKWLNVTDDGCQGGAGVKELKIKVYQSSSGPSGPWEQIRNFVIPDGGEDGEFADVSGEDGFISVPFYFDEDCWHMIEHWGIDAVGNVEIVSTQTGTKQIHKVDVTPPESSLIVTEGIYCHNEDDICVTTESLIEMIINNGGTEPCIYPETMGFFRVY
ncbi:MAG: hypothetical protein QCI00_09895, partial [Candidatus Thermoplasmatota archaeon]|nr:hypothetical protein [Candidatus Thermoplasmatota archaeon]